MAIEDKSAVYHEFLLRFSLTKKIVYGFVEGKEDPCFYRGFVEHLIPSDWDVEMWPAGNKDNVLRIHRDMNWGTIAKERVCFFVDRDLADIIPTKEVADCNIYVTDGYSIENDLVKRSACKRVLTEIFGLGQASHSEMENVCDLFELEFERFLINMLPVMACIVAWRIAKRKPCLNDIIMDHMFSFQRGKITPVPRPKRCVDVIAYMHAQCNIPYDSALDIAPYLTIMKAGNKYRQFTRGKYVFWFLVEFCRSIRTCVDEFFPNSKTITPMNVSISTSNAITIIGNRGRMPKSLRVFLNDNYIKYIEVVAA
jgi:hypothetical protein